MDKTFAETMGEQPFDWNKALNAAIEQEPSFLIYLDLVNRSKLWTTCAVGNACAIIPRTVDKFKLANGAPIDGELLLLGKDFHEDIDSCDWMEAKRTLAAIETRNAIVIRETLASLNQP